MLLPHAFVKAVTSTGQIPGQDGSGLHGTAQNGVPRQRFWRPERLPAVKICRLSTIILEGYVVGSSTVLLVNLHITYRRTMHTRSRIFILKNTRKRLTAGLRPGTLRALKRSPVTPRKGSKGKHKKEGKRWVGREGGKRDGYRRRGW